MEKVGEKYPDIVIGCVGGGSNFGGMAFPFLRDKIAGTKNFRAIAVEPKSCSTLLTGKYEYDLGDVAGMTPYLKMYTLGHDFIPPGIHAGGLRYHGMAPLVSLLYNAGIIEAQSYKQNEILTQLFFSPRPRQFYPLLKVLMQLRRLLKKLRNAKKPEKIRLLSLISVVMVILI